MVEDKNIKPSRNTTAQCYKAITDDLTDAVKLLRPVKKEGKINKWGAMTLLSRVYLYMGNDKEAYDVAAEAIKGAEKQGYKLWTNDEYAEIWATPFNSELLFEIVNLTTDSPGKSSIGYLSTKYNLIATEKYWKDYMKDNSDDVRSQMVSTASSSKPYCLKYPAQGSKSYEDANIPVFRLSELYLNAAEAAIKRNDIPNTRKYLKPIYARTGKDLDAVAEKGRQVWNEALGKIEVQGSSEEDKTIFYTSFYRFYERMICMSEDGRYYSGFDGKVHNDEGIPFYTDDWLWDTYRAAHPLRTIIEPEKESHMVNSYIRMSEQMKDYWMPTFPEVVGDVRGMNSNHGVAVVADCYAKGVRGFDLEKAYRACKGAITEKTLAPWSAKKKGELDEFFVQEGYFPALATGEEETVPEVHPFERRQPVSVTLGTVYDEWCLAQVANALGKEDEYRYFMDRSLNYKKIFHPETKFFHPKDKYGQFVQPFDYRYSGGQGARGAYAENNGWIYRWDVPHNVGDLIQMMGGNDAFVSEMERMYSTPLGRSKYDFFAQIPDHTGNVGQFSMANEPCLHILFWRNGLETT